VAVDPLRVGVRHIPESRLRLQWPLFAGFCVYAYYKFVRYEETPPEPRKHGTVSEIPSGLLPERPKAATPSDDDPALREYNAYLAELAKKDKEHKTL
jgi:DNA-binding transcriptional regulator of glucitol operon